MKENIVLILKEVLVCLGLIVIALGINAFLFKNYIPNNDEIDNARISAYESIERGRYIVINADIHEQQNPTQKHETNTNELDNYQTENRFIQGTINPFVSSNGGGSDLPSETIASSSN